MSADVRNWLTTVVGALASCGLGAFDALVRDGHAFGSTGDILFIGAGLTALGVKAAFDVGVQLPIPPKP